VHAGGGAEGEGENPQANSLLSKDPEAGLDPTTLDHDLSQNQESTAQPSHPGAPRYSS